MSDTLRRAAALERTLASVEFQSTAEFAVEGLLRCAEDLIQEGESVRSVELLEIAIADERLTPMLRGGRLAALRAKGLSWSGRHHDALAAIKETRTLLGPDAHAEPLVIALAFAEAHALTRLGNADAAIAVLQPIRARLLSKPDSLDLSICCCSLGTALLAKGRRRDALEFATEAVVSARRCGSVYWEATAHHNLAFIYRQECDWKSALRHAISEHDYAVALGNAHRLATARRALALCYLRLGDLHRAQSLVDAHFALRRMPGDDARDLYLCIGHALICMQCGRFDEARAALQSILDRHPTTPEYRPRVLAREFLADVEMELGHAAEALARYDEAWEPAFALAPRGDIVAELRRRRAECYLLLGRYERAKAEAVEAIEHCREILDRYELAATHRILALAEAGLGNHDAANRVFHDGFAHYEEIETPFEWGKLWVSYADWLAGAQSGAYFSLEGARAAYVAGIEHFERMGAAFRLEGARAKLQALDERMRSESELGTSAVIRAPRRSPSERDEIRRQARWAFEAFGIVTENKYFLELLSGLGKLARSDMSLLILGESGTGKELVAHGVHELSGRTGRYLPVNCSAIPDTMVESELFGHVQGAFTGAMRDKEGLLEMAERGTLFLDEIAEMPVDLQAKLLRALETSEVRRVGGGTTQVVNVRFVAATNRGVERLKRGEGFREDLFYRLSQGTFEVPPLRDRGHDVELLIEHFLTAFCRQYERRVHLTSGARRHLAAYTWPGNVRELKGVIHNLVVRSEANDVIKERAVAGLQQTPERPATLEGELRDQERRRILDALQKTHGVRSEAAKLLGMSRTTMLTKMARLGIR